MTAPTTGPAVGVVLESSIEKGRGAVATVLVKRGTLKAGDPITDGPFDPKELMEIKGIRETQLYLVDEVQKVYRDQGVSIHDKHIELIVRQMTK